MPTPEYEVVICTYNGAAYIEDQVRSILKQAPAPTRILISDDNSNDNTLDIINSLRSETDIDLTITKGPSQGIIKNMLSALPKTRARYVFLADQDDIWTDNKAQLFCDAMLESEQGRDTPHLIFSDAWVWNPDSDTRDSFWALDKLAPNNALDARKLAFHNTVQGASSCINRALINRIIQDDAIMMHDWWLALIAASQGSVSIVREPTLLYRQHDSNQIGSVHARKRPKLKTRIRSIRQILFQAYRFGESYRGKIPHPEQATFFEHYCKAMTGSFYQRLHFVIQHRPKHKRLRATLALRATILLTRFN